jgi:hypothetical protein
MNDLKKYQLKPEYKDLFRNLSRGEELVQKAAFDKEGGVNRKAYDSEDEARQHMALLKKLVDAGFVTEISTGITAAER